MHWRTLKVGPNHKQRTALGDIVEEIAVIIFDLEMAPPCSEAHLAADLIIDAGEAKTCYGNAWGPRHCGVILEEQSELGDLSASAELGPIPAATVDDFGTALDGRPDVLVAKV